MRSTQVVALGACAFVVWFGGAAAHAEELPVEPVVEQSAPAPADLEVDVVVAQSAPAPEGAVAQSAPAVADETVAQSAPAVDDPAPVPVDPPSGSIPTGTLDDGSTVAQAGPPAPTVDDVVVAPAVAVSVSPAEVTLPETGQGTLLAMLAAVLCTSGTTLMVAARRRV
jgi:LPXTG-motif cell wall-anchored protein